MLSFIVPTCIRNNIHLNQLDRCIQSIQNFHNDSNIYLIDDSDETHGLLIQNLIRNKNNISIINTKLKGSADQQVFKIIIESKDKSKYYIIIQDSMTLQKALDNIEKIESVCFFWHFTNHRIDWDRIIEPQTEKNLKNKIKTHTDLIRYNLINNYSEDKDFLNYSLECLKNKNKWVGCFGNCCIITKESVNYLNNKTNFADKFINNNNNRERRMNESIFALLCQYYIPQNYELSYDGLYYDGIRLNKYSNTPTGFDNLKYCCKNNYISKISFDR